MDRLAALEESVRQISCSVSQLVSVSTNRVDTATARPLSGVIPPTVNRDVNVPPGRSLSNPPSVISGGAPVIGIAQSRSAPPLSGGSVAFSSPHDALPIPDLVRRNESRAFSLPTVSNRALSLPSGFESTLLLGECFPSDEGELDTALVGFDDQCASEVVDLVDPDDCQSDAVAEVAQVNADEEVFQQLPFEGDEITGSAVSEPLAKFVEQCATKRIQSDKLKELKDQRKRPSNCECLVVPQVNSMIWRELPKFQRSSDLHMQSTQGMVAKGVAAVVAAKEELAQLKSQTCSSVSKQLTTAVAVLGNAFLDLSYRRRDMLRSSINRRYQGLCNASFPVTKSLFGDNVQETMKDINESTKLSRSASNAGGMRFHPYNRSSAHSGNARQQGTWHLNARGLPAPRKGSYTLFYPRKHYPGKRLDTRAN